MPNVMIREWPRVCLCKDAHLKAGCFSHFLSSPLHTNRDTLSYWHSFREPQCITGAHNFLGSIISLMLVPHKSQDCRKKKSHWSARKLPEDWALTQENRTVRVRCIDMDLLYRLVQDSPFGYFLHRDCALTKSLHFLVFFFGIQKL